MNKLLPLLVVSATLFLTALLHAAPFGSTTEIGVDSISIGEFPVGKTFTLKVTNVYSVKGPESDPLAQIPTDVPGGIPKFKKGQNVKFTIGAKGQLEGPGFSMKFVLDEGFGNSYLYKNKGDVNHPGTGHVSKNAKNNPTRVDLSFFKSVFEGEGPGPTLYSVYYTFK